MRPHEYAQNPLYLELYLQLKARIESGEYPEGSRLPSEKLLAEESGVSRITTKHALDQLVSEGYIKRYAGKGTFVQPRGGVGKGQGSAPTPAVTRPKAIGLVMEAIGPTFGADIIAGVEEKCAEAGYSLILKLSRGDEAREQVCIEELRAAGVAGILLMCVFREVYSPAILKLAVEGFPIVFVDHALRGLPAPYVGTDHRQAARDLTEALIRRGHKHLVLALDESSHETSSVEERVRGYVESCIDHDLLCANERIRLMHEVAGDGAAEARRVNIERTKEYLRQHPETTAVVALASAIGTAVHHALSENRAPKFDIGFFDGPKEVLAVRYDSVWVEQDQHGIGWLACESLLKRIQGEEVESARHVPYRLVERQADAWEIE